jgi:hypothetical protein
MANLKVSQTQPINDPDKENMKEIKETLKQAKNNSAVTDALKKEKQPVTTDDLSSLHDTRETGTSGGDQRAREADPNEAD